MRRTNRQDRGKRAFSEILGEPRSIRLRKSRKLRGQQPCPADYNEALERARRFKINIERKLWCNMWHTHFDWKGFGNISRFHRNRYLQVLFRCFCSVRAELKGLSRPYQVFITIHERDSGQDALFVHTPNPHTTFPVVFSEHEFVDFVPPLLSPHVNLGQCRIGRFVGGDGMSYVVMPHPSPPSPT